MARESDLRLWILRNLGMIFWLTLMTACQPWMTPSPPASPEAVLTPQRSAASPTATFLPTDLPPTEVIALEADSAVPMSPTNPETPTPLPDPLRLAFPTPLPAAVSAWRPALYPSPWAPTPYDHFYFSRPIAADEINWPLPDYRYGGVFFDNVVHAGVDIPAPISTPVLAAGPGKVTWAGYGLYNGYYDLNDPYGLAVLIRHDFGYQGQRLYTLYGHLDTLDVVKGQHVETGEVIGASGQTGMVTGPHLHFEVRLGKEEYFSTRNPELWLVPPQGWGVLAGRIMNSGGKLLEGQLATIWSETTGQVWKAKSYGGLQAESDEYYRENWAISDLPAGRYQLEINFLAQNYLQEIEILPGRLSYFTFLGRNGFSLEPPPLPGADYSPP